MFGKQHLLHFTPRFWRGISNWKEKRVLIIKTSYTRRLLHFVHPTEQRLLCALCHLDQRTNPVCFPIRNFHIFNLFTNTTKQTHHLVNLFDCNYCFTQKLTIFKFALETDRLKRLFKHSSSSVFCNNNYKVHKQLVTTPPNKNIMITIRALAILLALSSQAMAACVNDPEFEWPSYTDDGNPMQNCIQIRMKSERREAMCPIPEVNAACPHTCGTCCEDDDTYEFKLKFNEKLKGCEWILKNDKKKENRINNYCTENNEEGSLHSWDGQTVRDACPKSCNFCQELITAIDTPSETTTMFLSIVPTKSTTNEPSHIPSLIPSGSPSIQPSSSPSKTHTTFPSMVPSESTTNAEPTSQTSSETPTTYPSLVLSASPTHQPSWNPSDQPSSSLSTEEPSDSPTNTPSDEPSTEPSVELTPMPSSAPSTSQQPSKEPSLIPSLAPSTSQNPSIDHYPLPSSTPSTPNPSSLLTGSPTSKPSDLPTSMPPRSIKPSAPPTSSPTYAPSLKKPNLIMIITDEHNLRTLSCYRNYLANKCPNCNSTDVWGPNLVLDTPNIDALAEEGAIFTNFYTASPLCTPSRASFMTGLYPTFVGEADVNQGPLDPNLITWAEVLRSERGYHTGYMGKWHLDGTIKP